MLRSTLIIALITFSASGVAQELNYNNIQASYGQTEFDSSLIDVDGDGFGVSGSLALNDNVHIFGDLQTSELDFGVDFNIFEAGFGYNTPLSDTTDLVARVGYVRVEADAPGVPSQDDTGYSLGVGARSAVSEQLELNGSLDYVDSGSDGEARIRAGFLYNFTESFSAGVDGAFWEDVNVYRVSARFYF